MHTVTRTTTSSHLYLRYALYSVFPLCTATVFNDFPMSSVSYTLETYPCMYTLLNETQVIRCYGHSPMTIDYIITYIRGKYSKQNGKWSVDSILDTHFGTYVYSAIIYGNVDLVRVLYKHGYTLRDDHPHTYPTFKRTHPDIVYIMMDKALDRARDWYNSWCERYQDTPKEIPYYTAPDGELKSIVFRGLTECVDLIIAKAVSPEYITRLLSYSVAANRLDYVVKILDRGVDYNGKRLVYRAHTRGYANVYRELYRRGSREMQKKYKRIASKFKVRL